MCTKSLTLLILFCKILKKNKKNKKHDFIFEYVENVAQIMARSTTSTPCRMSIRIACNMQVDVEAVQCDDLNDQAKLV